MRINRQSVLYGAFVMALSGCGIQVLLFLYRIVLSRLLGAEGMGIYQLLFPPIAVLSAAALSGLTVAVTRFSAEAAALGDVCGLRRTVRAAEGIFLAILAPVSVFVYLKSDFVSEKLLGDIRIRPALLLVPLYLFLLGFENLHKAAFHGVADVKPVAISELTELAVRMGAVFALFAAVRPAKPQIAVALIALGMVAGEVFSSVFMTLLFRKRYKKAAERCGPPKEPGTVRKLVGAALPVSLAGVVNNLLESANAVVLPVCLRASGMSASAAMEAFGSMNGMILPLYMFPFCFVGSLAAVIMPKLSREKTLGNRADIKRKIAKSVHATGLFALPVIAVMIPLTPDLVRILYGREIEPGYVFPLALGSLFSYYAGMGGNLLYGLGMQRRASAIAVGSELFRLGCTLVLASRPRFGMYGYLAGFAAAAGLEAAVTLGTAMKKSGVKGRWGNWVVVPLVSAALCGYFALFLRNFLMGRFQSTPLCVIMVPILSAALYVLLLRFQDVRPSRYLETLAPPSDRSPSVGAP